MMPWEADEAPSQASIESGWNRNITKRFVSPERHETHDVHKKGKRNSAYDNHA